MQAQGSPLHNAVRQIVSAHPDKSPQEVADGMVKVGGIDPKLALKVVSDVFAQKSIPPAIQPNQMGLTPTLANQSRLGAMQAGIDAAPSVQAQALIPPAQSPQAQALPQVPQAAPTQSEQAPGTAPPSAPTVTPAAAAPTATVTPLSSQGLVPPASGAASQTPTHGQPGWLNAIERYLPLGLALLGGGKNPAGAAAFLSGSENARKTREASDAQDRQQAEENRLKQAQIDAENSRIKTQAETANAEHQGTLHSQFVDRLKGMDEGSQERQINALTPDQAKLYGVDQADYYDKDGKFLPVTAAQKQFDPTHQTNSQTRSRAWLDTLPPARQQAERDNTNPEVFENTYGTSWDKFTPFIKQSDATAIKKEQRLLDEGQTDNLGKLWGGDQASQQAVHDAYASDPDGFKAKYGLDYDKWQPGMKESDALRASGITETNRHNRVTEVQGSRRLTNDERKTSEAIRHNGVMEQVGGFNAYSERMRAIASQVQADSAKAARDFHINGGGTNDQSSKSVNGSPWGTVYDKAVTERDKASEDLDKWRQNPANQTIDDNGVSHPKPDDPTIVDRIVRADAQIQRMNDTKPPSPSGGTGSVMPPVGGSTSAGDISSTFSPGNVPPAQPRSSAGKALSLIGQKVNNDNQPACADAVCYIANKVGMPIPKTRSAGDLEQKLQNKGSNWQEVPLSQAGPNDIITSKGSGKSGRHVQWSIGNGSVIEANSRGDGYTNVIAKGRVPYSDPSAKAFRYVGALSPKRQPQTGASATSPGVRYGNDLHQRGVVPTGSTPTSDGGWAMPGGGVVYGKDIPTPLERAAAIFPKQVARSSSASPSNIHAMSNKDLIKLLASKVK